TDLPFRASCLETALLRWRQSALIALACRGWSHFYWRHLTRNTLPLTVGHLYPRIGPALLNIERLARTIGALTLEASRRDGRIAKYRYLHIVDLGTVPFDRFRCCQRLGLAGDFPVACRSHKIVRQERSELVRITCLL